MPDQVDLDGMPDQVDLDESSKAAMSDSVRLTHYEPASGTEHRREQNEVDLDDPETVRGSPKAAASGSVHPTDYDPAPERERKRGQIALGLVWLLIGICFGTFAIVVAPAVCGFIGEDAAAKCATLTIDDAESVVQFLLTPVVGLVGAVTGFYFGEKQSQ